MRESTQSLPTALALAVATAFFFIAYIVISPSAFAGSAEGKERACSCPSQNAAPPALKDSQKPWRKNQYARAHSPAGAARPFRLTRFDQVATLEAVQVALSRVGDGSSFVWHRRHGKLSGVIQPTMSFKKDDGRVCRHVVVLLVSGSKSKRTETIACRLNSGVWRLDS